MNGPSPQTLAARMARRSRRSVADVNAADLSKFPCPICETSMSVRSVGAKDWLGLNDVRVHALHCGRCGMLADRIFHPLIGYYPSIVI